MKPTKSYRIWFTQRSGSTLLCKALESTGVAGKPGEFFTLMGEEKSLCEKHKVSTYEALKQTIWNLGTTSNGVFGLKYAMHNTRYLKLFNEVAQLQEYTGTYHEEVWKDIFPNCQHIFLTRRNKVRQIVSWWKAIQDQIWHLEHDNQHRNDKAFYEERYDVAALTHLFKENIMMECAMQEYFSKYNIIPFTVIYEDFVSDYKKTIAIWIYWWSSMLPSTSCLSIWPTNYALLSLKPEGFYDRISAGPRRPGHAGRAA